MSSVESSELSFYLYKLEAPCLGLQDSWQNVSGPERAERKKMRSEVEELRPKIQQILHLDQMVEKEGRIE